MTDKEARNIGAYYYQKYKTVIVLSNGSVFLNADFETVDQFAKKEKLDLFITKGHEDRGIKKIGKGKI
jgi:hypothetical protein